MATRDYSSKQEQYVANYLGGKVTPNSGAGKWKKGDVVVDNILIECKTKVQQSSQITIKEEWLTKCLQECISTGLQDWALVFDFGKIGNEYAVIPLPFFKQLLGYREEIIND